MKPSHDSLSELLETWRVKPTADPNFRPSVFARVAALRRSENWSGYLRSHAAAWVLVGAAAVGAAGWTGYSAGRAKAREDRDAAIEAYVKSVDPRAQAGLKP